MKNVAIIVVNWNGKDDTSVCLRSLEKMDKKGHVLTTIVVDNGSTDDSVAVIKKKHPWVTIIETGKNLGFTGGNNIGISHALRFRPHYMWLLNNDTIVHKNALFLTEAFEDADVGIAGSKIYFAAGHEYHKDRYSLSERGKVLWYAGGIVDWDNMYASHRGVDQVDHGQYDVTHETPFVTGCSMMFSLRLCQRIGVLDDRYYLYLEDLDYCLRARRAGFKVLYYPKSVLWHVNAGSSGGAGNPLHEYYLTRNRLLIGLRFAPTRTKFALIREASRFATGTQSIKRRAVVDALFGRWGKQYEPKKFAA